MLDTLFLHIKNELEVIPFGMKENNCLLVKVMVQKKLLNDFFKWIKNGFILRLRRNVPKNMK